MEINKSLDYTCTEGVSGWIHLLEHFTEGCTCSFGFSQGLCSPPGPHCPCLAICGGASSRERAMVRLVGTTCRLLESAKKGEWMWSRWWESESRLLFKLAWIFPLISVELGYFLASNIDINHWWEKKMLMQLYPVSDTYCINSPLK